MLDAKNVENSKALTFFLILLKKVKRIIAAALRSFPLIARLLGLPFRIAVDEIRTWSEIKLIVPEKKLSLEPPLFQDPHVYWSFKDNVLELREVLVGIFKDARWCDHQFVYRGVLLKRFSNFFFRQESTVTESDKLYLRCLTMPRSRKVQGLSTVVGESHSYNYGHWIYGGLGRLAYVDKVVSIDKIQTFIVPCQPVKAFHRESLYELGIPDRKILYIDPKEHLKFEEVVVSGWANYVDPVVIKFLRERLLPKVVVTRPRRLYISRQRSFGRRIINEAELISLLGEFGFEIVFSEELSFLEQVSRFANAEWVVSAHGSNLANLLFCKSTTKVLEFFPRNWGPVHSWQICNMVGAKYSYLFEEGQRSCDEVPMSERNFDICVPMRGVRTAIQSFFQKPG